MSNDWKAPTTWDEVCRRAGGRRCYNRWRQMIRMFRRTEVVLLLDRYPLLKHGTVTAIARELNVHPSTVCRDLKALLSQHGCCPQCGQLRVVVGNEDFPGQVERTQDRFRDDVRKGIQSWAGRGRTSRKRGYDPDRPLAAMSEIEETEEFHP